MLPPSYKTAELLFSSFIFKTIKCCIFDPPNAHWFKYTSGSISNSAQCLPLFLGIKLSSKFGFGNQKIFRENLHISSYPILTKLHTAWTWNVHLELVLTRKNHSSWFLVNRMKQRLHFLNKEGSCTYHYNSAWKNRPFSYMSCHSTGWVTESFIVALVHPFSKRKQK